MLFDAWVCPYCGWMITREELSLMRFAPDCPRCGSHIDTFRFKPKDIKGVTMILDKEEATQVINGEINGM